MPLKICAAKVRKTLPCAAKSAGSQGGRSESVRHALPPQPALTSEKQKILINSIYSNKLIYAQGTDQPAQLS